MDRQIVCFRIPSFEIALARLEDAALRARPVAVAAATHPRAVLREVSREAAREGLQPGMAVDHARWLCPSVQLLPPSSSRIRRGQGAVQDIIDRFSPLWEPAGPGHLFLDLTGTHRLFGTAVDAAARIAREVEQRHGLVGALGVGTNKLVTDVATTLVEPDDLYDVRPGHERPFMAPLPPVVLPELARPAARALVSLLEDLRMVTLGAVADVPLPLLHLVAGTLAGDLHRHAQGIDESPVHPERSRPRITESGLLDPDTIDVHRIRAHLFVLVERLAGTLRRQQRRCRRIRLTVVHSDFVEASRESVVRPETNLHPPLVEVAERLLESALHRRVRLRRLIVEADAGPRANEQQMLFTTRTGEQANPATRPAGPGSLVACGINVPSQEKIRQLTEAVDRIRRRYGQSAVRWGRAVHRA